MVPIILSNGHAPTYQISSSNIKRQRSYVLDNIHQIFYIYLTLGSKFKVRWMSWWYTTHRLMVMHSHTKYHWLILKDKTVMAHTSFTNYLTLGSRSNECHDGMRHTILRSYTNLPNIIDLSWKEKKLWPEKASHFILPLFDLEVKG